MKNIPKKVKGGPVSKANPDKSVWDYLNSKGKQGNFASRKAMYNDRFGGKYSGTAEQNKQLLADLKSGKASSDKMPDSKKTDTPAVKADNPTPKIASVIKTGSSVKKAVDSTSSKTPMPAPKADSTVIKSDSTKTPAPSKPADKTPSNKSSKTPDKGKSNSKPASQAPQPSSANKKAAPAPPPSSTGSKKYEPQRKSYTPSVTAAIGKAKATIEFNKTTHQPQRKSVVPSVEAAINRAKVGAPDPTPKSSPKPVSKSSLKSSNVNYKPKPGNSTVKTEAEAKKSNPNTPSHKKMSDIIPKAELKIKTSSKYNGPSNKSKYKKK